MAKAKMTFKTPLAELRYANISGQGKLRYDPQNLLDKEDPTSYEYTITAILSKEQADEINSRFKKFWMENRPQGVTKMKYDLIKPEMKDTGRKDEDGDPIKEPTGKFTLQAKTRTVWPDGSPNTIKTLRANGNPINLGDKRIGDGSIGVIHGSIGINSFGGNEGLLFYLSGVQLKKFVEYTGSDIEAESLGDETEGLDGMEEVDAENISQASMPKV